MAADPGAHRPHVGAHPAQLSLDTWIRYDALSDAQRATYRDWFTFDFSARGRGRPIVYVTASTGGAVIFRRRRKSDGSTALVYRLLGVVWPEETPGFASLLADVARATGLPCEPALSITRVQKPKQGRTVGNR